MQTPMNFDPNTGAPLTQEGADIRAKEYAESQANNAQSAKKKTGIIIAIIISVLFLMAFVVAILIFVFFVGNGKTQVALAVGNTYNEINEKNKLLKALDFEDITEDRSYTVTIDLDTEVNQVGDVALLSKMAIDNDEVQISGDIDLSYIPTIQYTVQMDENQVRASTPLLDKYLFIYNYHEENDGMISEYVDTKTVNEVLEESYNTLFSDEIQTSDFNKDFVKAIADEYDKLEVKKQKKQKFEVDGKNVKCKAYSVIFSEEYVDAVSENTIEILKKYGNDLEDITGQSLKYRMESFQKLVEELKDTECIFYLYKNRIAAIHWLKEDEDIDFLFKGGNYRAENIDVLVNNEVVAQIIGSSDESSEKLSLIDEGEEIASYDYDSNTGKFVLSLGNGEDKYDFDMTIGRKNKGAYIDIGYIDLGDTYIGGTISILDGVEFDEIGGEEFNIGTADEDDVEAIVDELSGVIMGLLGW